MPLTRSQQNGIRSETADAGRQTASSAAASADPSAMFEAPPVAHRATASATEVRRTRSSAAAADPSAMFEAPPAAHRATASATEVRRTRSSAAAATGVDGFETGNSKGAKRSARSPAATAKKARFAACPAAVNTSGHTTAAAPYQLRSTTQQRQQKHSSPHDEGASETAKVTPSAGTATRNLNFDDNNSKQQQLPAGVVDIFQPETTVCLHSTPCRCPPVSHETTLQALASQHLTAYGQEYCQEMKSKEKRHQDLLSKHGDRATTSSSDIESDDDDDADEYETTVLMRRSLLMSPLDDTDPLPNQPLLTPKMRRVLVFWMSEVCVEYKLCEATYHLAVTILDLLLTMGPAEADYTQQQLQLSNDACISDDEETHHAASSPWFLVQRKEFQALGCACIWISSKMEDMTPPKVEDLVYISDYSFTTEKLRLLETCICRKLQFRLHRVTPYHFVHVNLRASQACPLANCHHFLDHSVLREMNFYLLEVSRGSYRLSHTKPSLLAAACMYLARATLGLKDRGTDTFWSATLEYYTGYSVKAITDTVLAIHKLQLGAEKSTVGVTPAFTKYKLEARFRVSLKTVRRVEDLGLATEEEHDDVTVDEEDYTVTL